MAYRVDVVADGRVQPNIAGATILAEALQSFARAVVVGAYEEVLIRDDKAGTILAEWRKDGLRHEAPPQTPLSSPPARLH